METLIIAAHILVALGMIGLILLQQGKGAEMGASFGSGSSQTLFGPQGAGTVFSRATAILTTVFFITSFSLAMMAKDKVDGTLEEGIPDVESIEQEMIMERDMPSGDVPEIPVQESDIPQ